MEKRAEGEREEERKRAETGGVLCGRRMQFEIGQIASFFFSSLSSFSPSAAHEAWYAPTGSLSHHKPDASAHTATEESPHSRREKNLLDEIKAGLQKDQRGFGSDRWESGEESLGGWEQKRVEKRGKKREWVKETVSVGIIKRNGRM